MISDTRQIYHYHHCISTLNSNKADIWLLQFHSMYSAMAHLRGSHLRWFFVNQLIICACLLSNSLTWNNTMIIFDIDFGPNTPFGLISIVIDITFSWLMTIQWSFDLSIFWRKLFKQFRICNNSVDSILD